MHDGQKIFAGITSLIAIFTINGNFYLGLFLFGTSMSSLFPFEMIIPNRLLNKTKQKNQ